MNKSLQIKQINSIKIKPVITSNIKPENIAGYDFFTEPYCNVAIIAKKKSGKSSTLYNILKKCSGKNTRCWLFSSTVNKDPTYKAMIDMLEKRKSLVENFTHFKDENGNILENILEELKGKSESQSDSDSEHEGSGSQQQHNIFFKHTNLNFGEGGDKKDTPETKPDTETKIPKKRKIYPEQIFCFDDLGSDMRCKIIDILLKTNRHYKSKVFLLGHTLTDLNPASRKQLDYCLIFKSFNEDKLKALYADLDLSIDFESFQQAYQFATKDPYNFLYIDVKNDLLRKNFNTAITFE